MKDFVYTDGIEKILQNHISNSCGIEKEKIKISTTSDKRFGDLTTSIAMSLAKEVGKNPKELAEEIVKKLGIIEGVEKIEIVNPGFINFFISNELYKNQIIRINQDFGKHQINLGKQIMVEYGQPNTHKMITIGHVKSAVSGLCVARMYETIGYDVIHANYFGDLGPYVAKTLYALFLRLKDNFEITDLTPEFINKVIEYIENINQEKGLSGIMELIAELYSNANSLYENEDNPTGIIKELNNMLFDKSNTDLNRIYEYTRNLCIEYQDKFFNDLGVKYDRQYPESEVFELGKKIVEENIGKIFVKDSDAIIFPGEKYDLPRYVFLTNQGNPTYHGKDMGLEILKFKEYPNIEESLVLTSVEQNTYFKVKNKALELIYPEIGRRCKHLGFGWLLFDQKKASSRQGNKSFTYNVLISEAQELAKNKISELKEYSKEDIEEISKKIAIAGFKFNILSHELHKDINYDPDSFMSLNGFSAPYIMYSYTRARSILNKAKGSEIEEISIDKVFETNEEMDLIKKILEYPSITRTSAQNLAPHILCKYLFELANTFNAFYTTCPIINEEDENIRGSRLLIAEKVSQVLKNGFWILGIDTVEKM